MTDALVPQAEKRAAPKLGPLLASRSLRTFAVLLLLWCGLALYPDTREAFLTPGNLSNVTAQIAEVVIIGVGMTFVVLTGGIDLSVGAGMALFGVVAATLQIDHHQPALVAIAAALSVAVLVGLWHGLLIARLKVPPFIATLSGFLAYRGLALLLSDARGLSPMGNDFAFLGGRISPSASVLVCASFLLFAVGALLVLDRRRRAFDLPVPAPWLRGLQLGAMAGVFLVLRWVYAEGMPVPVLIAAIAMALGAVVLTSTRLGRYAFAIGGNAEAARLSGVPVTRVKVLVYLMTAILTAVAGLVSAARTNGVTPGNMGLLRELHVITAVVIGGTSLSGGRATMLGTLLGALIFGTLSNGMNLLNLDSNWQLIFTGFDPSRRFGARLVVHPQRGSMNIAKWSVLLIAGLSATCAKSRPPADEEVDAAGGHSKVAFLLATLQEERYKKDKKYFEAMARQKGLDPFTLSADNDNARQLSQVEDALARKPKVLVIDPTDSAAAAGYVARAHAQGVSVVAYDRAIPGADFYVAHDSFRVGVIQAEEAIRATHGKGNYVLLDGQSGHSVAGEITRGYHETLAPYVAKGEIAIVVEKNHDAWSPEQALKTVEDAVSKTKGDIQAILANNSGMARGAVQAVQAAGLGSRGIFIAGADADAANVNYLCEKKQSIEVLKDIQPLAEEAATVAAALASGQTTPAQKNSQGVPVVAVPVVLITADNVKTLLIDSGFHSAAALPACTR